MTSKTEAGASSVEYGLLIALIAAVIVTATMLFGGFVSDLFSQSCDKMLADGVSVGVPTADCQ